MAHGGSSGDALVADGHLGALLLARHICARRDCDRCGREPECEEARGFTTSLLVPFPADIARDWLKARRLRDAIFAQTAGIFRPRPVRFAPNARRCCV